MDFNPEVFNEILGSAAVDGLTETVAEAVCSVAKSTAPVRSGEYQQSIHVEEVKAEHRTVYRVISEAPYALEVESKTGNLNRALKAVRRG